MKKVTALLLAGSRPRDPLALAAGVAAKALVPVDGSAMLSRVLEQLLKVPGIDSIVLLGPDQPMVEETTLLQDWLANPRVQWMPPAASAAASVAAWLEQRTGQNRDDPVLVTTADHALLRAATVTRFQQQAAARMAQQDLDAVVGLLPAEYFHNANWQGLTAGRPRTWLRFSDGDYRGCNLFYLNRRALPALAFWAGLETRRKQPWHLAAAIGWTILWRYAVRRLSLAAALVALSQQSGSRVGAVMLEDPEAGLDVDNEADRHLAEQILRRRTVAPGATQSPPAATD